MSYNVRLAWIAAAALIAGSSALLAAAQTVQQSSDAKAQQATGVGDARTADTVATLTVGTPQSTGALHAQPKRSAMPLTPAECADLGGTVNVDIAGICGTGLFCGTTDAYGKKHRVCLSKI